MTGGPLGNFGLVIEVTGFRTATAAPFIQVSHEARVSEIFMSSALTVGFRRGLAELS